MDENIGKKLRKNRAPVIHALIIDTYTSIVPVLDTHVNYWLRYCKLIFVTIFVYLTLKISYLAISHATLAIIENAPVVDTYIKH